MRLRAAVIAPSDPKTVELLPDAVVELDGPRIGSVQPFRGQAVDEDLRPGVLLPGFVDAHVHYPQARIVGRAHGPLLPWLEHVTFPEEARFADAAYARAVAEEFCAALAAAGTTRALVYGPAFGSAVDALLEVAERRGQPLVAGPVLMDEVVPADAAFAELERLVARWGRRIAVLPRFALSCSAETMARAGAFATRHDLIVSTHLAENVDEVSLVQQRFGAADYLEVYERAGLVRRGAVFAHCVHLSGSEWDRLRAADAIVAHCPDSNAFLGSGGMPIGATRRVRTAIGTDVGAGRSFRVPRILSAAYDNALRQGVVLTPAELLWMGTRGDAVGLSDVGFVREGARADLCLVQPPSHVTGLDAILSALLFDHDAPGARRIWVDGRAV